jgi:hypothetical protein
MVNDDNRRPLTIAAGIAALAVAGWMIWNNLPPAQLDLGDEQVFNTVDALFTALTSRDEKRLSDCERRIRAFNDDGKISESVDASLTAIIQQAEDGQWEPASKKLYDFMLGQRGIKTAL